MLAGIIRSPNSLSPRRHPEAAGARRNHVLAAMVKQGRLDPALAEQAAATPLVLAPPTVRPVGTLYVAAEVARELPQVVPAEIAEAPGLSVFTSIDADEQRAAERATRREPFLAGTEPHGPCSLHRPVPTALANGVGGVFRGGGRALGTAGRMIRDWFSHLFR